VTPAVEVDIQRCYVDNVHLTHSQVLKANVFKTQCDNDRATALSDKY